MKLKDFTFKKLETSRVKCMGFVKDGQSVVSRWKDLYPLESVIDDGEMKGFYLEVLEEQYYTDYALWNDCGGHFAVKYKVFLNEEYTVYELLMMVKGIVEFKGTDGYKKLLRQKEEKGDFISNADIASMTQLGETELAKRYYRYREEYLVKKEEAKREEEAQREAARKAEEEERKKALESKIAEAENCIRMKKRLQNKELEDGRHMVLYLMKKYGINVPLKTQGWINNKLVSVIFGDDGISLQFYRQKGCKCSQSVYHYLGLLKTAVDAAV